MAVYSVKSLGDLVLLYDYYYLLYLFLVIFLVFKYFFGIKVLNKVLLNTTQS